MLHILKMPQSLLSVFLMHICSYPYQKRKCTAMDSWRCTFFCYAAVRDVCSAYFFDFFLPFFSPITILLFMAAGVLSFRTFTRSKSSCFLYFLYQKMYFIILYLIPWPFAYNTLTTSSTYFLQSSSVPASTITLITGSVPLSLRSILPSLPSSSETFFTAA